MATYKYSRWDGSQQVFDLDEDDVLASLADDLLAGGDLRRALRNLMQRGLRGDRGQRTEGLRDLMERLRQQRQQQLERSNLDSLMQELKERLEEVVDTERTGIDRRLQEAREQLAEARDEEVEGLQAAMRVLQDRADRGRDALDSLPSSTAGAIRELRDYDFVDPEARQKFQELLDMLSQRMMENSLESMREGLQNLSADQLDDLKDMMAALNRMLRQRAMGLEPDFQGFMDEFGQHFDPDWPESLDELVEMLRGRAAAMQSLMESMSPEMRKQLESLLESTVGADTMRELAELTAQMYELLGVELASPESPFLGEPLTLEHAMETMAELQGLDDLEQPIRQAMRRGSIDDLDLDAVEELLGEDARRQLEQLQRALRQLEEAGYLKDAGNRLELTPRAIRKLGQHALREVFSALKKDRIGRHELYEKGDGGDRTGETRPLESGDAFDVDLNRTVLNAAVRDGPGVPVQLSVEDMEVHRTEHLTQAATVLLLDQSRSMGMFGSFVAAKKVALALYWLTHSQYPRDVFYVIGFSNYAIEIKGDELAELTWNDGASGTNMHHAFMLSRKLLSKQKASAKQILMITDGEPTAHLEDGIAYFGYPPSYRTIVETLKEVKRCTQAGININTFMMATSPYLVDFVDHMTKINRGRAFYTTASRLGRYVMVDYLNGRRKVVG